jgi:hypothetical protein
MFSPAYSKGNELNSFWYSTWGAQRILSSSVKSKNVRGKKCSTKCKEVFD